ncbi:RNA polymerase sigma factor [Ureibacillus sinduriensis]|uniref:RNA polymerase subunit sigma-24 n=1 Tax=Ureibacillus sinduriensis BLB-1 = JCM 15800 TaxID=1384057 RepID=A0A0A3HYR5_9BACL|nr:sigma-70 family RNA polymerase sigma factor [Ureibacillus sinduriensis]KGR76385.1 RNA polymerase subunit sigma-24 [Ureibacillus sinduriensis BLB-1 = JCM 15800]
MTEPNKSKENTHLVIKSIVEQVQSGNGQAYTEIIRRFQKKIYIYCYYLLGSKEEAEDATQDIFIKGLENIKSFSYRVSFSAWLYKIAHHHCMDLIKKKHKGNRFWISFKKNHAKDQFHGREEYRYQDFIHELLEKLSVDERRILLLRAIVEYSFDENASIMELKPATVRKKYERLRKKLIEDKKIGGEIHEHSFKIGG